MNHETDRFHEEDEMGLLTGVISGLSGHPASGIWHLHFEDRSAVPIESGCGVRALAAAFGAREGSGDLLDKIIGQEIVYAYDDMGLCMAGFTPMDEWENQYEDTFQG